MKESAKSSSHQTSEIVAYHKLKRKFLSYSSYWQGRYLIWQKDNTKSR